MFQRFLYAAPATILFVAVFVAPVRAITPDKAEFKKLADGVYAYVGKLNDANAMVVVTSQGVVVIDTGNNQPETRNILKYIQGVTQQPVRYVVITQNHGDHIGGTPLFSPPATVVLHARTAKEWAGWKSYQVNTWRKRFPDRAEALKNLHPLDAALTFTDRMTLRLGGKTIELIYVDDPYNPGDIAVWLPEDGILHAGFAGYKERHPDIRPDYSHGTTVGMMKQLEALIALKPKIVVPAHGPLMGVADLQAMIDYLVIARQKVRAMMDKGMPLDAIRKNFRMEEYKGWDREQHYLVIAATIYRELRGEGPEITPATEKTIRGKIDKIEEEGRFLTVTTDDGKSLALRISNATDIEGVPDRSYFKVGMRFGALYEEQKERNETLQFQVQ
jgi:cyclase